MVEKFRHRLIGAIVWITLAVIFVPAIFDGSGYHSLKLSHTDTDPSGKPEFEVKPQNETPQVDFKTIHKKLNLPPSGQHEAAQDKKPASDSSSKPIQSDRKSREVSVKVKAADGAAKAAGKPLRPVAEPRPPAAPPPSSQPDQASQRPAAEPRPPPAPPPSSQPDQASQRPAAEPRPPAAPPPSSQPDQASQKRASGPWFIKRVRTYNDKNSASIFIKRLRQAGYPAYLDVVVSSERILFTVAIGPIERHETLKEVKAYLADQHSIHDIKAQAAG